MNNEVRDVVWFGTRNGPRMDGNPVGGYGIAMMDSMSVDAVKKEV